MVTIYVDNTISTKIQLNAVHALKFNKNDCIEIWYCSCEQSFALIFSMFFKQIIWFKCKATNVHMEHVIPMSNEIDFPSTRDNVLHSKQKSMYNWTNAFAQIIKSIAIVSIKLKN